MRTARLSREGARLFQLVSRDLEFVAIGIAEVDRVRDLVILEFEFDSAAFEFVLRDEKVFVIGAKGQVQHTDLDGTRGRS
jgi:hypothetical protein